MPKISGCGMGIGFAPTWLRQVSPPASHDHFNHCECSNKAATFTLSLLLSDTAVNNENNTELQLQGVSDLSVARPSMSPAAVWAKNAAYAM